MTTIKLGRQELSGDILGSCIYVIVKCRFQDSLKRLKRAGISLPVFPEAEAQYSHDYKTIL